MRFKRLHLITYETDPAAEQLYTVTSGDLAEWRRGDKTPGAATIEKGCDFIRSRWPFAGQIVCALLKNGRESE